MSEENRAAAVMADRWVPLSVRAFPFFLCGPVGLHVQQHLCDVGEQAGGRGGERGVLFALTAVMMLGSVTICALHLPVQAA